MLTYPKSTMRVRRMPMHLSSGHVTLMPGKFYPPPPNFPQLDLGRRVDSRWALPQISSFIWIFCHFCTFEDFEIENVLCIFESLVALFKFQLDDIQCLLVNKAVDLKVMQVYYSC